MAVNESHANTILTNSLKYQNVGWHGAEYWETGTKTAIMKEAKQEAFVKVTDVPIVLF